MMLQTLREAMRRWASGVAVETSKEWLLHCGDATNPFYQKNEPATPMKPLPFMSWHLPGGWREAW